MGERKGLKPLWAPWRMEYLESPKQEEGCVFCRILKEKEDRKNLILFRSEHCFGVLNRYPYNNGHVMVVPNRHVAGLEELEASVWHEVYDWVQVMVGALKEGYRPQGFNIGMNLGAAAGAGIKDHLHMHIVPRWVGDTNFMPVLAEVKSMPQHLDQSWQVLTRQLGKEQREK